MDQAATSIPQPKQTGLPVVSWIALSLALASLAGASSSMQAKWPPRFLDEWTWTLLACFATFLSALSASRHKGPGTQRMATVSLMLALVSFWAVVYWYQQTYRAYPWSAIWPAVSILTVGGWVCNQRQIAIGVVVFLILWLGPAVLQPKPRLPARTTVGDTTVTVSSTGVDSYFSVAGPKGVDLGARYDFGHIEMQASAGPLVPLKVEPAWPTLGDSSGEVHGDAIALIARSSVPSWVRTWDLTMRIAEWPTTPAATVTFPIPAPGKTIWSPPGPILGPGVSLKVSQVRRISDDSRGGTRLGFWLLYGSDTYTGPLHGLLRATDDLGHVLYVLTPEGHTPLAGSNEKINMGVIDPRAKSIRIDAYSVEQLETRFKDFHFTGLPCGLRIESTD